MSTWLENRRAAARATMEKTPLPTLREENWRYTSLRGIDFDAYRSAPAEPAAPAGSLLAGLHTGGRLHQRGSTIVEHTLADEVAAQGVTFGPLEQLALERPDLVEHHLGAIVGTGDRFTAENAATFEGGAFLHVPDGVEVALPLHAVVEIPAEGVRTVWRMLVVAGKHAKVTLLEEQLGAAGYLNGVVELVVGDGAQVDIAQVQALHPQTYHFTSQRAEVARDATLRWTALALGGKLGKTRMESKLTGPGSTCRVTGLYALSGRQHLDLDTTQEHAAPYATSDLAFKGALQDRARSVWRGIIKVDEGAQKTDAFQENRNLLLSDRAHADSIPGLEILANDVRCTHAATVSQVDRELLFFLMARGFDRAEAQRMVVAGYFADALERVANQDVRERFAAALEAHVTAPPSAGA
jgi:Fe-S cluster assembly protein SufD